MPTEIPDAVRRTYVAAYQDNAGRIFPFGDENSVRDVAEEKVAQLSREDPGTKWLVAQRDVPPWVVAS